MIGTIVEVVGKVLDKVIPDPVKKAEALQKLAEMEQRGDLAIIAGQTEINKIDAASGDRFQSRWRPFIGWVCGGALALQLVAAPLLVWGSGLAGHPTQFPELETELLTGMVVSMLGIGTMRSYDKSKRV